MDKINKTQFYLNELISLHCNYCNSNLMIKYLNQTQQIILCSNKKVRINTFYIFFIFIVYVSIRFNSYG